MQREPGTKVEWEALRRFESGRFDLGLTQYIRCPVCFYPAYNSGTAHNMH